MYEQLLPYIIMGVIVFSGLCAVVVTRNISRISPVHNQIKKQTDVYISDLENQNKKLYGRVSQAKKSAISISPEEAADPFSAIGSIIDQIAPQLPASIRPLLKNRNAISFIENYVKSNPDAIKGIMEKFTSKQGNNAIPQKTADQSTL
jgi:hypothetical protein